MGDDELTLISIVMVMVPALSTFVWKRRMIRGGSWITKLVKNQAIARNQRRRRRLGDFLKDDLLRTQMKNQFLRGGMSTEKCDQHLLDLERLAAEPVTSDDVRITTDTILGEVMWRIWLGLLVWYAIACIIRGGEGIAVWYIAGFLFWVAMHMMDNKYNLGTFEIMLGCGGARIRNEEEDEALLHV